ncbi:hypothetical protein IEO70_01175 [Bacillus sp. AGMB 02131]|uniref:Uncharacterized protein n=1 Tax=Peribacillus faecalis TaxID=2772559 RepID=A0A927H9K6_9BACI|nr:hypothetical protein [Peribacillus faecalis]MBD3106989.1 hypothetical protein [Peribacillus faecalis]
MKSLNKFIGRAVIIAIFAAALLPPWIVEKYQQTLATGIYAVHYDPQASNCQFEKTSDETMLIQCNLAFENYSSDDVQFTAEFEDRSRLEDNPVYDLLEAAGSFKIALSGDEYGIITINKEVDVADLNNQIEAGGGYGITVTIQSEGKMRKL